MGLLRLLLGVLVGLLGLFKFWSSDKQIKKREDAELEKRIEAGTKALQDGDEDAVNKRLDRLTLWLVLLAFMLLPVSGCVRTRVEYIPAEMKAIHVPVGQTVTAQYDSWLVPTPRMAKLMEKAERYDALLNERPLPDVARPK